MYNDLETGNLTPKVVGNCYDQNSWSNPDRTSRLYTLHSKINKHYEHDGKDYYLESHSTKMGYSGNFLGRGITINFGVSVTNISDKCEFIMLGRLQELLHRVPDNTIEDSSITSNNSIVVEEVEDITPVDGEF